MSENLFSYGTLQQVRVQVDLFGRVLKGSNDKLKGYKLAAIEIKDESFLSKGGEKNQQTVIPSNNKDDQVEGTVFRVSKEELLEADKYEPANFKRIKVMLQSGKEAWIYAAASI